MVLPAAMSLNINQEEVSTALSRKYPHSTTEAGLCRSYNPTYVNYSGDGTGRDSYIILDNGGLTHEPKKHMQWQSSIRNTRVKRPSPSKAAVGF